MSHYSTTHIIIEHSDWEGLDDKLREKSGVKEKDIKDFKALLIEKSILNKTSLKFDFVGIICYKNNLILVFPKNYTTEYLDSLHDLEQEFGVIYRVIVKVAQEKALNDNSELNFIDNQNGNSELAISNSIIQDYINYGIYNKLEESITLDANKEIHWESTISLVQPIFSKKRPIYPDLYSFENFTQKDYIITQIHKWCVKYCLKKYGKILFNNTSFEEDVVSKLSDIGDEQYLLSCINKELNEVFIDRHLHLLQLIKSLIEKQSKKEDEEIIFGTTSFEMIWERVCQVLFNDQKEDNKKLVRDWSSPKYFMKNYEDSEGKSMSPDILSIYHNTYFTIDAKYYKMNDKKRRPGVQDVSKQYLYQQIYRRIFANNKDKKNNKKDKRFINLFVSPMFFGHKSDDFFKIIGNVSIQHFNETDDKIGLIELNTHIAYDSYLKNESRGYNELNLIEKEIKKMIKCQK